MTAPGQIPTPARDAFHAHLDVCRQCEQHPFDCCSEGQKLAKEAVKEGVKMIKSWESKHQKNPKNILEGCR